MDMVKTIDGVLVGRVDEWTKWRIDNFGLVGLGGYKNRREKVISKLIALHIYPYHQ